MNFTPLRKRLSFAANITIERSPTARPLNDSFIAPQVPNDDDEERNRRRSNADFHRRVSNQNSRSDTTELSDSKVQDHYNVCLQLYSENKINAKNAWNLHILDYIRSIVGKKQTTFGETLQHVSTVLDVGAKIYGLRVDDLHKEIIRLAAEISRNFAENNSVTKNNEDIEAENDEDGQAQKKPEKKKRTRQRLSDELNTVVIAKNKESINGVLQLHQTSYNVTVEHNKLNVLSCLRTQKYGYDLMVDSRARNVQFWTPLEESSNCKKGIVLNNVPLPKAKGTICPPFAGFALDTWNPEEEDELMSTSPTNEVVYDESGFPIPEFDFEPDHLADDMEYEAVAANVGPRVEVAHITDMRPVISSAGASLEYSYRAAPVLNERYAITGVWAGPAHWKVKNLHRPTPGASGAVQQRAKRTLAKNVPEIVEFDKTDEELEEILSSNGNIKLIKKKNAVCNESKYTLPEDLNITPLMCHLFFSKPWMQAKIASAKSLNSTQTDLNLTNYEYDNPQDADYCSQPFLDEENEAAHSEPHENGETVEEAMEEARVENAADGSLIEAPNFVQRTYVAYAAQAKRVDMKRLKEALWSEIVKESKRKQETMETGEEDIKSVSFSLVFRAIPKYLPARMAEEISCPLAFVALLHLANENNLSLNGANALDDVFISQ